jgi:hypothetical protein
MQTENEIYCYRSLAQKEVVTSHIEKRRDIKED